ncbi:hypothetical protein [Geofilum rubicundum]|uniref:Tetratricopeptide repeat protein n=1 Tax=Geofilum rubicundum JCM 15548 TaxID=1236989 RepID=A0A0E9LRW3_9BACT|nr:hypothetical protein [Geofilum rubicundum]GAO28028.1 hypothetical protein JCM15548_84 [Geofilum rubicundum JCM 15548]
MNKQQITTALGQPHGLNEQTLDQMREVLDEYPFFQAGRMLWIKNLHLLGHIRYNNELKLAAAHIADRSRLFELLHAPEIEAITEKADSADVVVLPSDDQTSEPDQNKTLEDFIETEGPVAADDYFGADEDFKTESGDSLRFTRSFEEEQEDDEEEIRYAFPDETENIVLPSADLLGYEMPETSPYRLSDNESANWDEAHSFSGWLSVLKNQPAPMPPSEVNPEVEENGGKKRSLIDHFLESGMKKRRTPPVKAQDKKDEIVDISAKSLQENEDLMTETLANIYIKQEHFFKAIDIFERLRLKYPEKNLYFARRIKELEEHINNQ